MPIRLVPPSVAVELGDGYDLSGESIRASALELPETLTLDPPEHRTASSTVTISSASSFSELISSLSFSASGEVQLGLASANARGSLALDLDVSEYQQHLVISSAVEFTPTGLRGQIRLNEYARSMRAESVNDFADVFGNGYVHSITYGGQLEIVISISTRSERQRMEVQSALSASVSVGKVTEETKASLQRFADEQRITTTVISQGFVGGVALSLDDALKLVQEFREQVIRAPRPVKFEIRRYPIPRLDFSSPVDLTELARIDEGLVKLVAAKSAFRSVITNPEQFCNPDRDRAERRIATIDAAIERLRDAKAAILAGQTDPAPVISESLFYIPSRWEPYHFDVMVATATPYQLTQIIRDRSALRYRIVGRFTIEARSPNRWRGVDSELLRFFIRNHDGSQGTVLTYSGTLPAETTGTLLVTVRDSTEYDDNMADPTDPIRIELAREVIYE